jgi:parallel beta-helix repeat protein
MKTKAALLLTMMLMAMLAFNIQPTKATGTIYIRADGSIDPPDAPISTVDNVTYTLTGNITSYADGIVVERSNIIIDGNGYTLQASAGSGNEGLSLYNINNVTIKNANIKGFNYGVYLNSTSHIVLSESNITNNEWGVVLRSSSYNTICGNNITWNYWDGIGLYDSSSSNTINKNKIENNISGIAGGSNNNTISENNITNNRATAISLGSSNRISGNNITNNQDGIAIGGSNTVSGNNINHNDGYGINLEFFDSSSNIISGNNITNNENGIELWWTWTKNNIIKENNITKNWRGVFLVQTGNNYFYHNNFINNTQQVLSSRGPYTSPSINVWDKGYPSGGNYWSNYTGTDANGDGIGDTPHIIDDNNQDRYPLMDPWISSEHEPVTPTPIQVQVGVKAGDWIKLEYTISGWPTGQPYPEWLKVEFLTVEGTNATVQVTMHMSDGTEQNATVPVVVGAGSGEAFGLSGFVIPTNLTVGNSVYITGYSNITIAGETTRTYAGASRTVIYTSFSQYGTDLTYYWDKQTGVMVEASTTSGGVTATVKATETNMWQAAPAFPIDPLILSVLIATVIVIVIAIFLVRRKKKPTETQKPET